MARSSFQPTEETHDLITEVIDQAPDTAIQQEDSSMKPPCANPVEMWPIDRPKPHPDNARKHSDEQTAQLAKSIESFQAVRSILVDEKGYMLAGHGLLLAHRLLGRKAVPVIVLTRLTEQQKQLFLK